MELLPRAATPLPRGRSSEVYDLLAAIKGWAAGQRGVRAVALVGSWARGTARADSDVDVVLLAESPARYVQSGEWLSAFGAVRVIRTRRWGILTERRLARSSGLEVDVGVASPMWASTQPLDTGPAQVAGDGLIVLYDPDRVLARLREAVCARDGTPRGAARLLGHTGAEQQQLGDRSATNRSPAG
jgi:uncharacterized protein